METISSPLVQWVVNLLGLPGVIFIIWFFDYKRDQRKDESRDRAVNATLTQYKEDVSAIKNLYENNVELVKTYEKTYVRLENLYSETLSVISLNTQAQTKLVEKIEKNMFCPAVREKGAVE